MATCTELSFDREILSDLDDDDDDDDDDYIENYR